jgi:transcriptional regulator of acetoin/glycerol metabolism
MFERYAWPGNIRQLANVLRTAAVMAAGEGEITEAHLSDDFLEDQREAPAAPPAPAERSLDASEAALIRAAVDAAGGNISEAAKRLGISRNTIYRKLR